MRPVGAYWGHFAAKSSEISTNGSSRSESGCAQLRRADGEGAMEGGVRTPWQPGKVIPAQTARSPSARSDELFWLDARSLHDGRPTLQLALDKSVKLLRCTTNDVAGLCLRNRRAYCRHPQDVVEDAIDARN